MFAIMDKAFKITMLIGLSCLGIIAGLAAFKIILGVTAVMLGSGLGTLLFIWIMWLVYKGYKNRHPESFDL